MEADGLVTRFCCGILPLVALNFFGLSYRKIIAMDGRSAPASSRNQPIIVALIAPSLTSPLPKHAIDFMVVVDDYLELH